MPLIHHGRQEIHIKVVYYGPGLGGKTTNLEHIHSRTKPELRGKLISLATESERTLFFDLLPVELGVFKGYQVRLHLCTVPGQIAHDRTRRLVLRHVDGIVFVVDSQESRLTDNIDSVSNLGVNLRLQGDDPQRLPLVVQYNKRDLPDILPLVELRDSLGIPPETVEMEAVATQGIGVFPTVKEILKECLRIVGDPSRAPEGRSASVLPAHRGSIFSPTSDSARMSQMPPAIGSDVEEPSLPPPPRPPSDEPRP